jgi:hypothetical protein
MLDEILDIFGLRQDRVGREETSRELFPLNFGEQIEDMGEEKEDQKDTHIYVYGPAGLVAAEHPGQPLAP